MKISIDTQHDSQVEIRKAIKLLMSLVGDHEVYTNEAPKTGNIFDDSPQPEEESSGGNIFAGMFGDNSQPPPAPEPEPVPPPKTDELESKKAEEDLVQFY